jgi:hypothetical protein
MRMTVANDLSGNYPQGGSRRRLPRRPVAAMCAVAFFGLLVTGCGGKPYTCVPVSGKVMYEDGSPIGAGQIRLTFISLAPPIDPKLPPKNGLAVVDGRTGMFDYATTFVHKDGIIVGEHKVVVQCINGGHEARNLVPAEYTNASTTTLRVRSSDAPFVIKLPKAPPPGGGNARSTS